MFSGLEVEINGVNCECFTSVVQVNELRWKLNKPIEMYYRKTKTVNSSTCTSTPPASGNTADK
jgi:hypothetical protein